MKKTVAPISLAGSQLGEVRHVCAFFDSDDEEYRVLLPFIKDGFECGDKAVHIVNPAQHHDHLRRLAGIGIDSATFTTVPSMNAMLEPRMVAAKIHGPFTAVGWEHRLLRIAASSQGGLAIVAICPFSAGSLSVGSRKDGARKHWRTSAFR
jgi:hypothetical protein